MRINYHNPACSTRESPIENTLGKKLELISTGLRINQAIEGAAGISVLDILRTPSNQDSDIQSYAYETATAATCSGADRMP